MEITKATAAISFYRGKEKLTGSGTKDLAYIKTDWKGDAYNMRQDDAYMREQLSIGVGEHIYGLGERFGAFVKNGQSIDIWNEDQQRTVIQEYTLLSF